MRQERDASVRPIAHFSQSSHNPAVL